MKTLRIFQKSKKNDMMSTLEPKEYVSDTSAGESMETFSEAWKDDHLSPDEEAAMIHKARTCGVSRKVEDL